MFFELGKFSTVIEPIYGNDRIKDFVQLEKFNQSNQVTTLKNLYLTYNFFLHNPLIISTSVFPLVYFNYHAQIFKIIKYCARAAALTGVLAILFKSASYVLNFGLFVFFN